MDVFVSSCTAKEIISSYATSGKTFEVYSVHKPLHHDKEEEAILISYIS
jgi:hypothetical protein